MKKILFSFIIPLAVVLLAVVAVAPRNVEAQTVVCPVGYVCTPVEQPIAPPCPSLTIDGIKYSLNPCSISASMIDGQGDVGFNTTIVQSGTSTPSSYGFSVYGYGEGFPTYGILGVSSGGAYGNTRVEKVFNDSYLSSDGSEPHIYKGYLPIHIYHGSETGFDKNFLNLNVNLEVKSSATTTPVKCYTFTTNLQLGSTGADVVALQTFLIGNGFAISDLPIEGSRNKGYFGPGTFAALKLYQASVGLPATGFLGPLTRGKINSECSVPSDGYKTVDFPDVKASYYIKSLAYKESYKTEEAISFKNLKGIETENGVSSATPEEGFNVQVYVYDANDPNPKASLDGINAVYDYGTGTWSGKFSKILANGLYRVDWTLYCSEVAKSCAKYDHGYQNTVSLKVMVGNTIPIPVTPYISNVAGKAAGNFEIDAGGSVGITGTNLAGYKDSSNVYIGGKTCTIIQISNTLIYCTAPSDLVVGNKYNLYINSVGMSGDKVTSNIVTVKVLGKVSQPSITVLSPNGGEFWRIGNQYVVNFSDTTNTKGSYKIYLEKYHEPNTGKTGVNSSSLIGETSTRSFVYTVPGSFNSYPGDGYTFKIKVCAAATVSCSGISDSSDNFFSIAPQLLMLYPNGGEILQQGSTITIKWDKENVPSPTVDISLLDDPTRLGSVIIKNTPNDGSENWIVTPLSVLTGKSDGPIKPSGKYVMFASCSDNECIVDDSNSYFKINDGPTIPQPPISPCLSPNVWNGTACVQPVTLPTLTLSSNLNSTYKVGDILPIKWTSKGVEKVNINLLDYKGSTIIRTIATVSASSGQYDWKVSDIDFSNSSTYVISVSDASNSNLTSKSGKIDFTPAPVVVIPPTVASCTIAPPTVSVTAPYIVRIIASVANATTSKYVLYRSGTTNPIYSTFINQTGTFNAILPDPNAPVGIHTYTVKGTTAGSPTCSVVVNVSGEIIEAQVQPNNLTATIWDAVREYLGLNFTR